MSRIWFNTVEIQERAAHELAERLLGDKQKIRMWRIVSPIASKVMWKTRCYGRSVVWRRSEWRPSPRSEKRRVIWSRKIVKYVNAWLDVSKASRPKLADRISCMINGFIIPTQEDINSTNWWLQIEHSLDTVKDEAVVGTEIPGNRVSSVHCYSLCFSLTTPEPVKY